MCAQQDSENTRRSPTSRASWISSLLLYDRPHPLSPATTRDFHKAFDSVEPGAIWESLRRQGIDSAYINLLKECYTNCSTTFTPLHRSVTVPITRGPNVLEPSERARLYSTSKRKLDWAGHVARRTENRWTTLTQEWIPRDTKRPVGRPPMRWIDALNKEVTIRQGNRVVPWSTIAKDRKAWCAVIRAHTIGEIPSEITNTLPPADLGAVENGK
ncbi:unnamed protein product [Caenorhabditis sp. 36 PRJEB53466]|nr:unnamed protein product [Caenorhabditis sp. 36 PRJEB53466]